MMEVFRTPLGFTVEGETDKGHKFRIECTRIVERNNHLEALTEIRVKPTYLNKWQRLHYGYITLTSARSKRDIVRYLQDLVSEYEWEYIIEGAFQRIVEEYYTPEKVVKAKIAEETALEFLLEPVLVKGHPVLIYAQGGTGKSLLAQYMSLLLQNGLTLTRHPGEKRNVLYLDWELDEVEFARRLGMLVVNLPEGEIDTPFYKKCTLTLSAELPTVLRAVMENDIGLVVVDSAGPAIGGDINETSKVIEFFNCVRKVTAMGVTVLILSHVSKQSKKEKSGTPIGSVYFENLSRICWELKQSYADGKLTLGLFCRKSNFGSFPSIGFEVSFEDGLAFVDVLRDQSEIKDLDVAGQSVPELVMRVLEVLGEATVSDLAREINVEKQYLWLVLHRLKEKGLVTSDKRGVWRKA